MGIPQLWNKLGEGEMMDIATYAAQHFENHKRPLRIAIDEAIWRKMFWVSKEKVDWIRDTYKVNAHPNEKSFLWRVLQLQRLNCQLVFVNDGPQRPKKRGKAVHGQNEYGTENLQELLQELGCVWHKAPGEAEAECVELQRLGLVDVVWSEDGDSLMFGASALFRFKYTQTAKGEKKKDNWKVRVYRTADIEQQYPCLTREGLVLFALLVGADYDKQGLKNIGAEQAIRAAKNGLGALLCKASDEGTLSAWRERLQRFLIAIRSKVEVPKDFPGADVVRNYYRPVVSSEQELRALQCQWWTSTFDPNTLRPLFWYKYNMWLQHYVELIVPILLVRSLAQTLPGQEASNKCYRIQRCGKAGPSESKIKYNLSAVTSLDLDAWYAEETFQGRPEKFSKLPSATPECDAILDSILRYAVPDVMEKVPDATAKTTKSSSSSKKRSLPTEEGRMVVSGTKPPRNGEIEASIISDPAVRRKKPVEEPELKMADRVKAGISTNKPSKKAKVKAANTASYSTLDDSDDYSVYPSSSGEKSKALEIPVAGYIQSTAKRVGPDKAKNHTEVIDLVSDDEDDIAESFQWDKSKKIKRPLQSAFIEKPKEKPSKQPLDPTLPNTLRLARLQRLQPENPQLSTNFTTAEPQKQSASGFIRHFVDSDDED